VDKKERDKLIMKYAPLVKNVVGRMTYKLPIDTADREDLVNVGIIGLMEALEKFDKNRNVQFETYARFRIRGAVLDELRSRDWVPRSIRHKDSKLEKAFDTLKKRLGRAPDEYEVAEHLGITLEAYFKLLDDAKGISMISQEDLTPDYIETHCSSDVMEAIDRGNPLEMIAGQELKNRLKNLLDSLPMKEKLVVSLYYYEEMTMKEIGRILELTESRVCQLHTQAMLRLRGTLKDSSHPNRHVQRQERKIQYS
jgi:RNA polymerase sigma factor FliA